MTPHNAPVSPPPPNGRPLIHEIGGTLWSFTRGQAIIAFWLALFYTLGFYIIELPYWWLVGPLNGALAVIPFLGAWIGAAVALGIAGWLDNTWRDVLETLAVLAGGQALEGLYLTPRILGDKLRLRPLAVFLAIIVGSLLLGPLGAFLAAPVAAVALLVWRRMRPAQR